MQYIKKIISNEVVKKIIFLICIIATWLAISKIINNKIFLPSPLETFRTIADLLRSGELTKHSVASFMRVTIGIVISSMISIPLGFAIVWNKTAKSILKPIVDSLRFIPVTCFSPLLILFFGIDEKQKIIFLIIVGVFSFLPTVIQIASEPREELIESAFGMGFIYPQPRMLWYCIIPDMIPELLQSIVTLYGVGWTYMIIVELNNANYGLGHLMYIGSARGRTSVVFAAIVVIIVIAYVTDKLANFLIRKVYGRRFKNG